MTSKIPKPVFKIVLGFSLLTFAVASCNGGGGDKKDPPPDTAVVKPMEPMPIDTSKMDTATTRPVKTPD
jgi:hypothetical protein